VTTIAACLDTQTVAADSRMVFFDSETDEMLHSAECYKLYKTRKYIIGCAGNADDIEDFLYHLAHPEKRRRKVKEAFSAILLSRKELLMCDDNSPIEPCRASYHAIGSGAPCALASMATMEHLGLEIDVQLAVRVACVFDSNTAPPIDVISWRKALSTTARTDGCQTEGK